MKRRIFFALTSLALASVLLCVCACAAQGGDADSARGRFYLESFGIPTDSMDNASPVSRGFAARVISMMLYDDMTVDFADGGFADIAADSDVASAAYLLGKAGIMNGDGIYFSPNETITYSQAAKIFVASLGKNIAAEAKGGYPAGYIAVAAADGIFDGVSVKNDDALTFGDFAKMFYNYTDCKGFVLTGDRFSQYEKDDKTVFERKLDRCDMMYIEGVVTANQFGSAADDEIGKISVDGAAYDLACDVDTDIIGYAADVFLTKKNSKYIVTSVMADPGKNEVFRVEEADIASVSLSEIKYYDGAKTRTLSLSDVSAVRNGKIMTAYTKDDLVPLNGGLVLVDNDSDGKYEYVYVENRQYFKVDRVNADENVITLDDARYEGSALLYINPDDSEFYHRIYTQSGDEATFADIKADSMIRIEGSTEQKMLRVYIIDSVVEGMVDGIDYDTDFGISVNGQNYGIASDASGTKLEDEKTFDFSTTYRFTVDSGRIIEADEVKADTAYGYVIDFDTGSGLSNSIKYKLVSEDKRVYVGELADRIIYNGSSVDKKKFIPKKNTVISYKIDSDGKICYIKDAEKYSGKSSKIYNSSSGMLYSQTYEYPLFMSDDTVVFLIPDSGEDDDYMADLSLVGGEKYTVESFDYNEDDSSVSVVLVYRDVKYDTPGYIKANSPICILKSRTSVLDEDENQVYKLVWLEGQEEKSALVKSTDVMNRTVAKMSTGDVFQYSLTSVGLVDNVNTLVRLDQNPAYFHYGANSNVEKVYGRVVDATYKKIPKGYKASFVNVFTLDIDGKGDKNFLVTSDKDYIYYYVYDSEANTVKAGSFDDILTEDGVLGTFSASDAFIYYYTRDAIAVVIRN